MDDQQEPIIVGEEIATSHDYSPADIEHGASVPQRINIQGRQNEYESLNKKTKRRYVDESDEEEDQREELIEQEGKKDVFKHSLESCGFTIFLLIFEILVVFIFFFLVRNGQDEFLKDHPLPHKAGNSTTIDMTFQTYYHVYIEIAIMIFLGFGLLMTFLKLHGLYAMAMGFLISCFAVQMTIICIGYADKIVDIIHKNEVKFYIVLDIPLMIKSMFASAAVLISMGVVIGKFTPFQLILMAFIEIPVYAINVAVVEGILKVSDVGGSMLIHMFGAYFGLVLTFITTKNVVHRGCRKETTSRVSEVFSITGTICLWICWPSFNSALDIDYQHRIAVNTFLSLVACCITAFIFSRLLRVRFGMADLQNATIAGGVAIGSSANMELRPGAPTLIGIIAGCLSVVGFRFLMPFLKKLRIHDTCGVNNLHGMPGILGGTASIFATIGMGKKVEHENYQPLFQLAGIATTFSLASIGGFLAGLMIRGGYFLYPKKKKLYFEDNGYFIIEEEEEEEKKDD